MLRPDRRPAATLAPVRRPSRPLALAAATLALGAVAAPAHAQGPIMPLAEVQPGMRCTALSVVRGNAISSFDVEILDTVRGEQNARDARILVRVSGPAIDATGLGPGFSGSPVLCPDAAGVQRNAGAISETVGEYGNKLVLVTPIEQVLGEPVDVPAGTPPAPAGARSLAGPVTFSGLSEPVAAALRRAGRATGRLVQTSPLAPGPAFPPQQLVPGAAMAAGLASGDLNAGVDRHRHVRRRRPRLGLRPSDRRRRPPRPPAPGRLRLRRHQQPQRDAGGGHATSSPPPATCSGRSPTTRRTPSPAASDRPRAASRCGSSARDLDTGRVDVHQTTVTDERPLGEPGGASALSIVGPVAVAQAAFETLRGAPALQSGDMCLRIEVRERPKPMRFCNRYVGGVSPDSAGAPMAADVAEAVSRVDAFRLGELTITKVEARISLRRQLRQAYLTRIQGPDVVRRGRTVTVRVTGRLVRGGTVTRRVRVRVPRDMGTGERELVLVGTPADQGGDLEDLGNVLELSLGGDEGDENEDDDPGPRSLAEVARSITAIHRFDGVRASLREPGPEGSRTAPRQVLEDPQMRFSGVARLRVLVR